MAEHAATFRTTIIQPVVPSYRIGFFDAVAGRLGSQVHVFASDGNLGVLTEARLGHGWLRHIGPIRQLAPGAQWQVGAVTVPVARGDVVVISGAPRCMSNIALLVWARLRGARTIWWGQLWSASSRWHRFVFRMLLMRLADAVLFYTDDEVEAYRAGYGRNDGRPISALNNGIDVKPIRLLRAPYAADSRGNAILFIGRLTQKADIALLLEAMAQPPLQSAVLHVVGDGPDAPQLGAWARDNGLASRVIWHGGTVDESEIATVANQSAVFCYPGGVGLSLVHAMAYGLPAVLHDDRQTHMPEIAAFEAGVTGVRFAKGDPQALAMALASLLRDTKARERMSAVARDRADTTYNTDSMAVRFTDFVRHVAGEQPQCERPQ